MGFRCNWAELSSDALSIIFEKLGAVEVLLSAQAVCRSWRRQALEPGGQVWRCIDMRYTADFQGLVTSEIIRIRSTRENIKIKCLALLSRLARLAIDRSNGQAEKLYVRSTTDDFLTYIAGQTTKLRCFALVSPRSITTNVLVGFVAQCPLLEEIHIYGCQFPAESCRYVGRARPELKCLRVDELCNSEHDPNYYYDSENEYDRMLCGVFVSSGAASDPENSEFDTHTRFGSDYCNSDFNFNANPCWDGLPFEIADNMLHLRELHLTGTTMTNKGLHAILDKCLHLEYLDIRCSFKVRVDKLLQAKLAKIKTVRISLSSQRRTVFNIDNKPFF